ncbi:MAG: Holliday junction resolvase RuvX [Chloroflexi bacterium]|nr:MAG: Holliday junction resolvase RuvX [Chloroflexota bacterium]
MRLERATMARLMALDVGDARIGVAISDASGFLASPYITLHVSRDEAQTRAAIQRLISETEAEGLVVGLPISLDGQIHTQGARVQAFAERLKEHISIPLTFWDERLSTVEAQRLLAERQQAPPGAPTGKRSSGGRTRRTTRRKHRQHEIDALAAAVILQEYLDHASSETGD